jgi:hypothetical protein
MKIKAVSKLHATAKLLRVSYLLENGDVITLDIKDNEDVTKALNAFISYLVQHGKENL